MRLVRLALALAALAGLFASSACVHVRPWQRQKLAKESMVFDDNPAENMMRVHLYDAREGAAGGEGSGGGGCGCN